MITGVLTKIFGSRNERLLKRLQSDVARINALEPELVKLSDEQLGAKTAEFRTRLSNGESLDNLGTGRPCEASAYADWEPCVAASAAVCYNRWISWAVPTQ